MGQSSGGYTWSTIEFSAEIADSIFGKAKIVQPPAIQLLPCIKL